MVGRIVVVFILTTHLGYTVFNVWPLCWSLSFCWFSSPASPASVLWVCCWSCEAWDPRAPHCPAGPAWHPVNFWRASGTDEGSSWPTRCSQHTRWWGASWTGRNDCRQFGMTFKFGLVGYINHFNCCKCNISVFGEFPQNSGAHEK